MFSTDGASTEYSFYSTLSRAYFDCIAVLNGLYFDISCVCASNENIIDRYFEPIIWKKKLIKIPELSLVIRRPNLMKDVGFSMVWSISMSNDRNKSCTWNKFFITIVFIHKIDVVCGKKKSPNTSFTWPSIFVWFHWITVSNENDR